MQKLSKIKLTTHPIITEKLKLSELVRRQRGEETVRESLENEKYEIENKQLAELM